MSEAGPRPAARRNPSLADLARSMSIVVVVALLVWLVGFRHHGGNGVHPVNAGPGIAAAQRVAAYHVLAPTGLPRGWRATSVRVTQPGVSATTGAVARTGLPTHLHIGYISPTGDYIAVEESDAPAAHFIALETAHGHVGDVVPAGGRTFTSYTDGQGGVRALVYAGPHVTVVIAGATSAAQLTELAASLQ